MAPPNTEVPDNVAKKKRRCTSRKTKTKDKLKLDKSMSSKLKSVIPCLICPICWDNLELGRVCSTKCGHIFCQECLTQHMSLRGRRNCPTCRQMLIGPTTFHPLYLEGILNTKHVDSEKSSEQIGKKNGRQLKRNSAVKNKPYSFSL